jgi:hypothetical protein
VGWRGRGRANKSARAGEEKSRFLTVGLTPFLLRLVLQMNGWETCVFIVGVFGEGVVFVVERGGGEGWGKR